MFVFFHKYDVFIHMMLSSSKIQCIFMTFDFVQSKNLQEALHSGNQGSKDFLICILHSFCFLQPLQGITSLPYIPDF